LRARRDAKRGQSTDSMLRKKESKLEGEGTGNISLRGLDAKRKMDMRIGLGKTGKSYKRAVPAGLKARAEQTGIAENSGATKHFLIS